MAPEIIMVVGGHKYDEAVWIIPPVAISLLLLFYAQLFINVQFYYEKKKSLVYASILAAVVNIVLNAILIPRVSYIAAGYTTLFSYIIFAFLNYIAMRSVAKEKGFSMKAINAKILVLLFAVFSISCFGFMFLYGFALIRYCLVLILALVALINRKKMSKLFKDIQKKR